MMVGEINQIIPFSSVDGPGNRTAIFLQGCNFNCIYCHNPETIQKCTHCGQCVDACEAGALELERVSGKVIWDEARCVGCGACTKTCVRDSSPKTKRYTPSDLMASITPYLAFIQGITVSGGECTLQSDFVTELFRLAKSKGLSCFLDTNGSTALWQEDELMAVTDGVMLDVKSWDTQTHTRYIGEPNDTVKANLEYLISVGKLYEVRTVILPEVLDAKQTVEAVARQIGQSSEPIRYKLITYRKMGVRPVYQHLEGPDEQQMKDFVALCKSYGCRDVIVV
ncbi:MAG: YjjW family glycine radical enzyme activase [Cellulosilyticaceae bacterium]